MPFNKRSALQLFYPEPLDGQDYTNLRMSGIKRVQLFYKTALVLPRQLEELARMGVAVTVRLEEPDMIPVAESYYNTATHSSIKAGVEQIKRRVAVEAVIAGNEPEHAYGLHWGGQWGNNPDRDFPNPGGRAQAHSDAVRSLVPVLRSAAVRVVSPGWTHKRITPSDAPQPGRAAWRELCLPAYNACDGNGAHVYAHAWVSPEDENRFLWAVGGEVERCHRAVWLNEFNVNAGRAVERMAACRRMCDLLNTVEWGGRVVSATPFCSNGTGQGYGAGYIMRDAQAYFELGQWLQA